MNKNVANILQVFENATPEQIAEGLVWYSDARAFCKKNAKKYNVSIDVVIATLSALSPRNHWSRNLTDTITVLEAVKAGKEPHEVSVGTFHCNKEKAFAIVRNGRPSLVKLSNKTASFFDNIKYASSEAVTIDTHAYSIYHGHIVLAKSIRDKEYNEVADAYREAAKILNLRPYEVQACCWNVWKKTPKVVRSKGASSQVLTPLSAA